MTDRVKLPGVTTILKAHGIIDDKDFPNKEWYMERGKLVHAATALSDLGELNLAELDAQLGGFVDAWKKFREKEKFTPRLIEHRVENIPYQYCGILDREGDLNGFPALLDIKCGKPQPWAALQTAGYDLALPDIGKIRRRLAVHLKDDGSYVMTEYSDFTDRDAWLGAVVLYHWRKRKGGL